MPDQAADAMDIAHAENQRVGARARAKRVARDGLPALPERSRISDSRRDAAQYRAGVALLWTDEQILAETGWSLQRFMAVKRFVADQDQKLFAETDPAQIFATYEQRQLQCARELEDLAEIFRESRQFSAMVNALRTRSDIIDRIVKMGQELGLITRAAKKVEVEARVDVSQLSIEELRVHVSQEFQELQDLLQAPALPETGPAAAVMRRVLPEQGE